MSRLKQTTLFGQKLEEQHYIYKDPQSKLKILWKAGINAL